MTRPIGNWFLVFGRNDSMEIARSSFAAAAGSCPSELAARTSSPCVERGMDL
jgi:hypothetical protein